MSGIFYKSLGERWAVKLASPFLIYRFKLFGFIKKS